MKIGIFTFHRACNYGAVLQCYALQEYLKGMGHDVSVIDYRPKYIERPYSFFRYSYDCSQSLLVNAKIILRQVMLIPVNIKQRIVFNAFQKKHLSLSELDLTTPKNNYDVFILGSDQIWNSGITGGILDKIYFGQFPATEGKTVISYAASAGTVTHECNQKLLIASAKKLRWIGVRERNLFELLSQNLPDNIVKITIDPTLLVGSNCLNKIALRKKPKSKYLLAFQLKSDRITDNVAEQIASERKLKLVRVSPDDSIYRLLSLQGHPALSVGEFLWYVANADYIVTSSFHGTALSIVYGKNFSAVINDEKIGERIRELLAELNLSDRIIDGNGESATGEVRYDRSLLDIYKRSSGEFLKRALSHS